MLELYDQIHRRYGRPVQFMAAVRAALTASETTQAELSRFSGYSPTHVTKWVNGKVLPSMRTLAILDESMQRILRPKIPEGADWLPIFQTGVGDA